MLLCDVAMGRTLEVDPARCSWRDRVKIAQHIAAQYAKQLPAWSEGDECYAQPVLVTAPPQTFMRPQQWQKARVSSINDGQPAVRFLDHSGESVGEEIQFTEDELMPNGFEPSNHPSVQADDSVQDLAGTPYHSTHILSASAPLAAANVIHPVGAAMPIGELVARKLASKDRCMGADEIVVYDKAQARICYVVELCEQTHTIEWSDTPLCEAKVDETDSCKTNQ